MKGLLWFASAVLVARGLYALYEDLRRRNRVQEQAKDLQTWEGEGGAPSEGPATGLAASEGAASGIATG
jgi:hypothetical protein